ncbi:MMPL family transporter [Gephyromycinifex aptenodytis]|uniref:MMPL family transporter n=1 Tax=Gephyromycinifex aptenodytis TaxID=2716227 RepID=UPI001D00D470|nr:MMPL family transporter [Gephyromycinifex aptenodytis]
MSSTASTPHSSRNLQSSARGPWPSLARLVSRRGSAFLLLLALLLVGAVMAIGSPEGGTASPDTLPANAESAQVDKALATFPDSGVVPAIAVFSRRDAQPLSPADLTAAAQSRERAMQVDRGVPASAEPAGPASPAGAGGPTSQAPAPGAPTAAPTAPAASAPVGAPAPTGAPGRPQDDAAPAGPPVLIPAPDAKAAIATIPLNSELSGFELTAVVDQIRAAAAADLPESLQVQVTGGPAFGADIANAFKGADFQLLASTALVVAVLLLITYRSPILWLLPLIVVALADRTAAVLTENLAAALGFPLDGSTGGITSVLVFGAGTNYALLLVSRYREELRRTPDHRLALARAVRGAGPAILASNVTVVLALLMLLFATLPNTRLLGFAGAVGLLVAVLFGLFVLPPALALAGRRLFWPFIPRDGDPEPAARGGWFTVATFVAARPLAVLLATIPILLLFASGLFGVRIGLDQIDQFRVKAEAVEGFETLRAHFPAGESTPTSVVAHTEAAPAVQEAITATSGVEHAAPTGVSEGGLTRWRVVLEAEPGTSEALASVQDLRASVRAVPGAEAIVGGSDAKDLDSRDASRADELLLFPLILGVVLLVLFVLLQALWAPLLLIVATTLSAVAAIGAGAWLSIHILGFPAIDTSTPLFAFLFLVALGVDYTIFLVTRAREETPAHGTKDGIVRAVALTGGVITSAGVVLAAVFAVLGVLPLITLTQLGIIVGLGILLDTFVVRTLVIPAIFTLVGRRVWWPSALWRVQDPTPR